MKQKLTKKNIIIVIAILVLLIILTIGIIFVNKDESNNKVLQEENNSNIKYNKNEKVVEDKNIDNITFTDFECSFDGTNSLIKYTITNKTNNTVNLGEYELIVKDKEGNILTNIMPNFDYDLKPKETYEMGNSVNIDLSDAYSIEFKLDNKKVVD